MSASRPEYGIVIAKDVMVPMRDGVRLATDIYYPARDGERVDGPLPTILGRTSYDKTWPELWVEPVANFFAPRGYVVAIQDLRGRHKSEGTGQYYHTANAREGQDGCDAVEWIASQPWSNGRVGMTGSSHSGIVQTMASLQRPPHLAAIWIDVAPTNIFAHQSREGGAMSLQMFGALFLHAYDSQEIRDDPLAQRRVIEGWERIGDLAASMPFKPGHTPLAAVPNLEEVLFHYYYDGEYNDFWDMEACNQEPHFHRAADIPGVFSGGWYDPFAAATTNQYAEMAERNETPQRLIMGPWIHNGMRSGTTRAGDVDFGPRSAYGHDVYNAMRLRWFDRWLKGVDNGVEDDPPVRIFVMGGGDGKRNAVGRLNHGGRWRSEPEWPIRRAVRRELYLRSGGRLAADRPDTGDLPSTYTHDPRAAHPHHRVERNRALQSRQAARGHHDTAAGPDAAPWSSTGESAPGGVARALRIEPAVPGARGAARRARLPVRPAGRRRRGYGRRVGDALGILHRRGHRFSPPSSLTYIPPSATIRRVTT